MERRLWMAMIEDPTSPYGVPSKRLGTRTISINNFVDGICDWNGRDNTGHQPPSVV
jgi:hypothetical protein